MVDLINSVRYGFDSHVDSQFNLDKMKLSKAIQDKIEEINIAQGDIDQFYCDFNSTVEETIWDLHITFNERFAWIEYDGTSPTKIRFTLSDSDQFADFRWYLAQFRKSIKKELKYA